MNWNIYRKTVNKIIWIMWIWDIKSHKELIYIRLNFGKLIYFYSKYIQKKYEKGKIGLICKDIETLSVKDISHCFV